MRLSKAQAKTIQLNAAHLSSLAENFVENFDSMTDDDKEQVSSDVRRGYLSLKSSASCLVKKTK